MEIRLLEKLRELRELAYLELKYLVNELVKDELVKNKILNLEYNSVTWSPKGGGKLKGYDLRVYEKRYDEKGKEKVKQRYVASYPPTDEVREKLKRLSYLYRLVKFLDKAPKGLD